MKKKLQKLVKKMKHGNKYIMILGAFALAMMPLMNFINVFSLPPAWHHAELKNAAALDSYQPTDLCGMLLRPFRKT